MLRVEEDGKCRNEQGKQASQWESNIQEASVEGTPEETGVKKKGEDGNGPTRICSVRRWKSLGWWEDVVVFNHKLNGGPEAFSFLAEVTTILHLLQAWAKGQ